MIFGEYSNDDLFTSVSMATDNKGPSAISTQEQEDLVQIANDQSVDINQPNNNGVYPIHRAVSLQNATQRSYLLHVLIGRGVDVNVREMKEGLTPLHLAVSNNQVPEVSVLLTQNAICDMPDNNGKTPIDIADENHHEEMITMLESYKKKGWKWKTLQRHRQVNKNSSSSNKEPYESCVCVLL